MLKNILQKIDLKLWKKKKDMVVYVCLQTGNQL